jgi:uncharacterized protein (DUF1501 family)
MTDRRKFIQMSAAAGLLSSPLNRVAFANADTEARYVFVILRGGMDGLAAVSPYADGQYKKLRGTIALSSPSENNGALDLDGFFGLHPSFKNLHHMYRQNDALVFHAVASAYRDRSHFDGQKLLENGTDHPLGADDGWLNRALNSLSGKQGNAIAMAQKVPLVLYGDHQVNSWAPASLPGTEEDTLDRIMRMYQTDDFLMTQLQSAIETRDMADSMNMDRAGGRQRGPGQLTAFIEATGKFLTDADGPRIAVLESTGWDTHANQGSANGQLANQFRNLDEGLKTLKDALGQHWNNTVVTVVTEFGRTVAVNGTNGTDHGTASAALMLGGAVNGGKVITDWPGLSKAELYENRDLRPTLDMRSLFKSVLHDHMKVSMNSLDKTVFPDSNQAKFIPDLISV